jgi:hypothetical protein
MHLRLRQLRNFAALRPQFGPRSVLAWRLIRVEFRVNREFVYFLQGKTFDRVHHETSLKYL